ncbi:uncharacterized protein [Acropora muricata]|uniref:uncharacterized protein isoform X1 n=1 Tax=Acropora muricata TaxID=159855 RepID=UPI0034E3AA88
MGFSRFLRNLNCITSNKRSRNSTKEMETELKHLNAVIREKKKRIETTKWIIEKCQQQESAMKREQAALEKRSDLMEKVAQVEIKMQETMKYRQEIVAERIKGALRRRALESRIMALRKVGKFWKAQPEVRSGEFWRGELRPIRSMNDIHKAVLKPPLFPNKECGSGKIQRRSSEEVGTVDKQDN